MSMSKTVNTKELSESRLGCFCLYCHTQVDPECAIAVPSKSNGTTRYICRECGRVHNYAARNNDTMHKKCKHGEQFGIEFEGGFFGSIVAVGDSRLASKMMVIQYLAANYHLLPSEDCTVSCELKSPRYYSKHGIKATLKSIFEVFDLTTLSSGQHINYSKLSWKYDNGDLIEMFGTELFGSLAHYLKEHENECIKVFGRYFKSYCEYTDKTFEHGYWLNIKQDYALDESCIEFRLAKFTSVTQYFHLICFCSDVIDIIDKWMSKYQPFDTTEKRNKQAENVGKKILFKFLEYRDEQATAQQEKRNSCEW